MQEDYSRWRQDFCVVITALTWLCREWQAFLFYFILSVRSDERLIYLKKKRKKEERKKEEDMREDFSPTSGLLCRNSHWYCR